MKVEPMFDKFWLSGVFVALTSINLKEDQCTLFAQQPELASVAADGRVVVQQSHKAVNAGTS